MDSRYDVSPSPRIPHSTPEVIELVSGSHRRNVDRSPDNEPEEEAQLYANNTPEEFAAQVMSLMWPVSCCLLVAVFITRTVNSIPGDTTSTPMVYQENSSDSGGTKLAGALLNTIIIVAVLCVTTFIMLLLYKFRCTKVLYLWLILSCVMFLGFFTMNLANKLFQVANLTIDYVSFVFLLWNFAAVGVLAIFWHAPLLIKQAYLVCMSAMVAWMLTNIPEWTSWGILAGVAIWDLFAVLAPCGPLKALLKESIDRNEPIPGLVYETSQHTVVDRAVNTRAVVQQQQQQQQQSPATTTRSADVVGSDYTALNAQPPPSQQSQPQSQSSQSQQQQPLTTPLLSESASSSAATKPAEIPTARKPRLLDIVADDSPARPSAIPRASRASRPSTASAATSSNADTAQQLSQQQQVSRQSQTQQQQQQQQQQQDADPEAEFEDDPDHTVKLGLGDFIFYSALLGRASMLDTWPTVVTCFTALLSGLCLTLMILAWFQKPLPALPISIALGIFCYFLTSLVVDPFLNEMLSHQVFL